MQDDRDGGVARALGGSHVGARSSGAYCRSTSPSMKIETSSPTTLLRYFEPKSERLIVVVAEKPAVDLKGGSSPLPVPTKVTLKVTGLVTPMNVRSPVMVPWLPCPLLTAVETKVSCGNFLA